MTILELRKKTTARPTLAEPERRDLYDKNRRLTGETIFVSDPIPEGKYILVVRAFIVNSSGHYLIQKRSKERNGLYGVTGGHPKSGQTSLQGIVAEIREEIGIDVNPADLKLFHSDRSDEKQCFFDDYYLEADIPLSKMKFQKDEVQFATWFMRNEVKGLFKRGKLMAGHYEEFLRLQDWLNKQHFENKRIEKKTKN